MIEQTLHWLITQFNRAIASRKETLLDKTPGAVGKDPSIYWVQMINRPFIRDHIFKSYNIVVELRSKFNSVLELEVKHSRFCKTIEPQDNAGNWEYFDTFGNLTFLGKINFWKYLNAKLKAQHSTRMEGEDFTTPPSFQTRNPQWNRPH